MSYQLLAIRKLCQDACQHLMLQPYITASRTMAYIVLSFKLNQAMDIKSPVASLGKWDLLGLEHSLLFFSNLIGQFQDTKPLSCPQLRSPQLRCPLLSGPLLICPHC